MEYKYAIITDVPYSNIIEWDEGISGVNHMMNTNHPCVVEIQSYASVWTRSKKYRITNIKNLRNS